MIKKLLLLSVLICAVVGLATCKSPERLESALQRKTEPCLSKESSLNKALSCLNEAGVDGFYLDRTQASFMDCGPYWGYPLYASCAGVAITHEGDAIREYKTWHRLDGVWWPRNDT